VEGLHVCRLLADNTLPDLVPTNGKQIQRTARISLRLRIVRNFIWWYIWYDIRYI